MTVAFPPLRFVAVKLPSAPVVRLCTVPLLSVTLTAMPTKFGSPASCIPFPFWSSYTCPVRVPGVTFTVALKTSPAVDGSVSFPVAAVVVLVMLVPALPTSTVPVMTRSKIPPLVMKPISQTPVTAL